MQKMCRCMIQRRGAAPLAIHTRIECVTHSNLPLRNPPQMSIGSSPLLRITDDKVHARARKLTGITNLTTRLRIKGSPVEHNLTSLATVQLRDGCTVLQQGDNLP